MSQIEAGISCKLQSVFIKGPHEGGSDGELQLLVLCSVCDEAFRLCVAGRDKDAVLAQAEAQVILDCHGEQCYYSHGA